MRGAFLGSGASRSATALLVVAALGACGSPEQEDGDAELTAVATTPQVADLVENVGGERVEVRRLLAPGADPHSYEPRPSDAETIAEAAAVFRSGGDLDEWLADVVDGAGAEAREVSLLDAVADRPPERIDPDDPHWWQDPRNARAAVDAIAGVLAEVDPAGARGYRDRARRYSRRLAELDRAIARCLSRVPRDERKLVTTHDSYGYFADRYGIEVIGALIQSRSTQAQPSAGATAELVERIEAEGARAVFPESPLDPDLERAVAEEAEAMVGDPLWGDSLGPPGSDGATYAGALAADARAMVEGFTGGRLTCRAGA